MKNDLKSKFTIITNNIVNEPRLTAGAKGIACYLLSKPEEWKFFLSDIEKNFKESKFKIQKYIKELEEIGFLKRIKVKNSKGQFIGLDYVFNNDYIFNNEDSQQMEKPTTEKTGSRLDPLYNNTNINNTNNTNTNNRKENKKEKLNLDFLDNELLKDVFENWLDYKKEIKNNYKTQRGVETAYKELKELSNNDIEKARAIVESCINKEYKGLYVINNFKNKNGATPW